MADSAAFHHFCLPVGTTEATALRIIGFTSSYDAEAKAVKYGYAQYYRISPKDVFDLEAMKVFTQSEYTNHPQTCTVEDGLPEGVTSGAHLFDQYHRQPPVKTYFAFNADGTEPEALLKGDKVVSVVFSFSMNRIVYTYSVFTPRPTFTLTFTQEELERGEVSVSRDRDAPTKKAIQNNMETAMARFNTAPTVMTYEMPEDPKDRREAVRAALKASIFQQLYDDKVPVRCEGKRAEYFELKKLAQPEMYADDISDPLMEAGADVGAAATVPGLIDPESEEAPTDAEKQLAALAGKAVAVAAAEEGIADIANRAAEHAAKREEAHEALRSLATKAKAAADAAAAPVKADPEVEAPKVVAEDATTPAPVAVAAPAPPTSM